MYISIKKTSLYFEDNMFKIVQEEEVWMVLFIATYIEYSNVKTKQIYTKCVCLIKTIFSTIVFIHENK